MHIKRVGFFAATAATALLLTACGPSDDSADGASAPATPATPATPAAPAAPAAPTDAKGAADLSLLAGTAQSNKAPANTGDFANKPGKPATAAGAKWVGLVSSKAGSLDPVVVNGAGMTLYRFDKDTAGLSSKSNCNDACAVTWPPVVVAPRGKIFISGVAKKDVGVVKRDDGQLQVTIGGWPVYRFSKDLKPGDTNGQGVGGTWFGVTPGGQKAGQSGGETGTTPAGAPATRVVLFDDKNFADNGSQAVAGRNSCQPVSRTGVASSLETDGTVKIWDGPNCTGHSEEVSGNVADLALIGFDDKIASIRFS